MRRYRIKKMQDGKWAVLMCVGPGQWTPVKGEVHEDEGDAIVARDRLKRKNG